MPANEDELYQERILDHYETPYHRGHCPQATHVHEDDNPLCGDVVRLELDIDSHQRIQQAYFEGDGCCISQAAASMLVQHIEGKSFEESQTLSADDMLRLFGAPADAEPAKMLPAAVAGAASGVAFARGIGRLTTGAEAAAVIQYPNAD